MEAQEKMHKIFLFHLDHLGVIVSLNKNLSKMSNNILKIGCKMFTKNMEVPYFYIV
jgi:hypothetical protein